MTGIFTLEVGVRQGGVLRPKLLIFLINDFPKQITGNSH